MSEHFRCRECSRRFCDEKGELYAEGPDGVRQRSLGPAPGPRAGWPYEDAEGNRKPLLVCPLPNHPPDWGDLAQLHRMFESGSLPWPGSLQDQPAWFPGAMRIISAGYAKALEVKADK